MSGRPLIIICDLHVAGESHCTHLTESLSVVRSFITLPYDTEVQIIPVPLVTAYCWKCFVRLIGLVLLLMKSLSARRKFSFTTPNVPLDISFIGC